jgi:hypothetical protein
MFIAFKEMREGYASLKTLGEKKNISLLTLNKFRLLCILAAPAS